MSNSQSDNHEQSAEDSEPSELTIEKLNDKIDSFQAGLQNAWDAIEELRGLLDEASEERRHIKEEQQTLQHQLNEIDRRTDLLRLIENGEEVNGKQRSVILIQSLRRAAERKSDRGRKAKSSVNREEAERALGHPDVDRTTIYTDMQRAERLVGDQDIVQYVTNSEGETRLKMNLEAGELPSKFSDSTDHEVR
jgi:septal ring factor EnvC (AmiA/AmiB activator)